MKITDILTDPQDATYIKTARCPRRPLQQWGGCGIKTDKQVIPARGKEAMLNIVLRSQITAP